MTAVFAIALDSPNQEVDSLVSINCPGFFKYSPTLYLVVADGLAETVAINVGIKGEERVSDALGFVIKLEEFSYSGYTSRSLWEWLREADKQT